MIFVFMGPPGCGKGTQADLFKNFIHINAGELLRHEIAVCSEIGLSVKSIIDVGGYVPDGLIFDLIKQSLNSICQKDIIIDGYPRTIGQAVLLEEYVAKNNVIKFILFEIDDEFLIERITGRYMCLQCGAIYNQNTKPTKVEAVCDECGANEFSYRSDDNVKILKNRLRNYHTSMDPLIDFYSQRGLLYNIDASKNVSEVNKDIMKIIEGERSNGAN